MKQVLFTVAFAAVAGIAVAATHTYKCPKCGLIQQYDRPGIFKCPNDGFIMVGK